MRWTILELTRSWSLPYWLQVAKGKRKPLPQSLQDRLFNVIGDKKGIMAWQTSSSLLPFYALTSSQISTNFPASSSCCSDCTDQCICWIRRSLPLYNPVLFGFWVSNLKSKIFVSNLSDFISNLKLISRLRFTKCLKLSFHWDLFQRCEWISYKKRLVRPNAPEI